MSKDQMNPRQREAVDYTGGPLLILAGAGSGKTRVLTAKIADIIEKGYAEPWEILAMTFTNKAAQEMRGRVESVLPGRGGRVRLGTFHSICAWILRREAHYLGYNQNFVIYDADDQKTLIRRLLKGINSSTKITPGLAKGYISRSKNEGISSEEAMLQASGQSEIDLAEVYHKYQERLKSSGAFDFDDLLTGVLAIFRQNDDIRKLYSSMFSYILVDEYQDTNKVQHELLKELSKGGAGICVVGDDDQSIYAWRGACVENILEFSEDFPGTRIIRLEENYRSSGNILRGASALVNHNRKRHGKTLWTKQDAGHPITVKCLYNETEEAEWILNEIVELIEDGSCPSDSIAVLYRTNAQSRQFETVCRKHGVNYEVVGSQRFYERMEIKDIIAYLRVVINHDDRLSLERIINKPARGLGGKGRASFFAFVDSKGMDPVDAMLISDSIGGITSRASKELSKLGEWFRLTGENAAGGVSASEIVDSLIDSTGLAAQYDTEDITDQSRLENITEFRRSVSEYDQAVPGGDLPGFMTDISLATTVDEYEGENSGKVALMTLHCAKGLEFNVVFIAGLEEGMLPFIRPGEFTPSNMEEERRLLYVGMTRARERLLLTCALNRKRAGVAQSGPSRFIAEIASGESRIQPVKDAFSARAEKDDFTDANENITTYSSGNLIRHPRYGIGLVKKAVKTGSEWRITVDFGFDEPKTLVTGYVPIPILKQKGSIRDLD
ncbi:MAG: AAA family ATPase [Candidatus Aegiribacteria sp.]|nr:AAA family ATPase [Candidatus Aegiribacteria sp.]